METDSVERQCLFLLERIVEVPLGPVEFARDNVHVPGW